MKNSPALLIVKNIFNKFPLLCLGLLLSVAGSVAFSIAPPLVLEQILNSLSAGQAPLAYFAVLYFAAVALGGLCGAAKEVMITRFGQKVTHGLRSEMCGKLSKLPAGYFFNHEPGQLSSRFTNDADAVDSLFTSGIIGMFADGVNIIAVLAVIFVKSRGLGLLMALAAPLLLWMTRVFQKRMLAAQRENRRAIARVNAHLPETIRAIRMIHIFSQEAYMEQRYGKYIDESYRATDRSNIYDSLYSPIVIFLSAFLISVMMVLAAAGGGMQQFFGMSVGTAVAVIAYVSRVFEPIESIGMEIQSIQSAMAGYGRINAFLKEEERPCANAAFTKEALLASGAPCVSFENVSFAYQEGPRVLQNLSFTVKEGEMATLAGRTGAGKSTAFRLLLGLYEPAEGSVRIYGAPPHLIAPGEMRKIFGYVEQSFRPVPGTVKDQINLFDEKIGLEQIKKAAELVGLGEAIAALPAGYETPIGEAAFSQGQLQLLSIARALVSDPPLLLLDEITANLDSDTERRVLGALDKAAQHRTVLSISHRLYQQKAAGRLIEIGDVKE